MFGLFKPNPYKIRYFRKRGFVIGWGSYKINGVKVNTSRSKYNEFESVYFLDGLINQHVQFKFFGTREGIEIMYEKRKTTQIKLDRREKFTYEEEI